MQVSSSCPLRLKRSPCWLVLDTVLVWAFLSQVLKEGGSQPCNHKPCSVLANHARLWSSSKVVSPVMKIRAELPGPLYKTFDYFLSAPQSQSQNYTCCVFDIKKLRNATLSSVRSWKFWPQSCRNWRTLQRLTVLSVHRAAFQGLWLICGGWKYSTLTWILPSFFFSCFVFDPISVSWHHFLAGRVIPSFGLLDILNLIPIPSLLFLLYMQFPPLSLSWMLILL